MSFGTKNVDTTERSGVSKYLHYGIVMAKITGITVEKAKSTESKRIVFHMEGAPIMDKSFEGIDGAKGAVCKMATSYMNADKSYQDFMRQIGVIADKLGVRPQVDAITASTIEQYIAQVAPYFTGLFAWWCIGAEEYNEGKFSLKLLKFAFIKSLSEIDPSTLVYDGNIAIEAKNNAGVEMLKFDKTNKYQYTAFVKPDSGFQLPGAAAQAQTFQVPSSPTVVGGPPKFDDFPVAEGTSVDPNNPHGLPF